MRAFHEASHADRLFHGRLPRTVASTIVAAALLASQVTLVGADTLKPAVDNGGSGGGGQSVTDMLRGDYSPIAVTAVTEVEQPLTVADMIRGDLSPILFDVV